MFQVFFWDVRILDFGTQIEEIFKILILLCHPERSRRLIDDIFLAQGLLSFTQSLTMF